MRWKMQVVSSFKGIQDSQSSEYLHRDRISKEEWKEICVILTLTCFLVLDILNYASKFPGITMHSVSSMVH